MNDPESRLPARQDPERTSVAVPMVDGIALPALVLAAGEEAARSFLRFFIASIRNRHTRRAYARSARDFLAWCEGRDLTDVREVRIEHAAAYVELLTRSDREASSVKQGMAALRMLFGYLQLEQVVTSNPFAAV